MDVDIPTIELERPDSKKPCIFRKIAPWIMGILIIVLFVSIILKRNDNWKFDEIENAIGCRNERDMKFLSHLESNFRVPIKLNNMDDGFRFMKDTLEHDYAKLGIMRKIPSKKVDLTKEFSGFSDFSKNMTNYNVPEVAWRFVFDSIKNKHPSNWGYIITN